MHAPINARKDPKNAMKYAERKSVLMNKILLLGINARYTHSNPALLYLKKSIADLGIESQIAEFTTGESADHIIDKIAGIKPELLAVSVYIWNAAHVKKILKTIKLSLPGLKIVLGGPEVSYNSEEWLDEFSEIDFIISGAGESAFRELVITGARSDKKIIQGNNPHFSSILFPYTDGEMKRLKGRYIYYESSRGCPFNCSYCLSSVKGQNVELRKLEQVKEELDFFASYSIPLLKFVDRTFNMKREHYLPVWEYIIKKFTGSGACFHFEIFPELLVDEDLKFLSKAPPGLFQFEMGIQSTNTETLKEINRSGSWAYLERNIKTLAGYGNIHLHTDLIAGLPYEGFTGYADSFNRVYSLGAEHLQGGVLKVLPGTVMRSKTEEYGMSYSHLPPYEITGNRWITPDEVAKLKLVSELVDLVHNQGKFNETEKFMVSLYRTPFDFYARLADIFKRDSDAGHRKWERLAVLLLTMAGADFNNRVPLLTDYLRWDWCTVMKNHRYPGILKPDNAAEIKRRALRFFTDLSVNNMVSFAGHIFPADDLRRSIFFVPETEQFMNEKMKDKMALFLPDKHIIFFNTDNMPDL